MIVRGGENICPREIEEFIITHPNVSELQLFGTPDPKLEEEVCAWVIVRPDTTLDPDGLRKFCQN
jgi:fatty-acyl-CoA synthase